MLPALRRVLLKGVAAAVAGSIITTYIGFTDSGAVTANISNAFAGVNIGTASADRLVVVGAATRGTSGSDNIATVTVDAASLTRQANSDGAVAMAIFSGIIASGSTATITVSMNVGATATQFVISVWTITGLASATPASAAATGAITLTTPATITYTPGAGGVTIYLGTAQGSSPTFTTTWSGGGSISESVDTTYGVAGFTGGKITGQTAVSGTITMTLDASASTSKRLAYAQWN